MDRAFSETYRMFSRWIDIFLSLQLKDMDRATLTRTVDTIDENDPEWQAKRA